MTCKSLVVVTRSNMENNDSFCFFAIDSIQFVHSVISVCIYPSPPVSPHLACVCRRESSRTIPHFLTTRTSLRPRCLTPSLSEPTHLPTSQAMVKPSCVHPMRRECTTAVDNSTALFIKPLAHTTVQVLSHFCGQASSFPQAPTMEQKISPLGQSPWVCSSLMSPSTKMLSHSWNLQIVSLALKLTFMIHQRRRSELTCCSSKGQRRYPASRRQKACTPCQTSC